jgi:hypothetical protein
MNINPNMKRMIDRCSRLWAAEAEVFRSYWDSPIRTADTDRAWLQRQMYKELIDGVYSSFKWIQDNFENLETKIERNDILDEIKVMQEEFIHYSAFMEVYELLNTSADMALPNPSKLRETGAWKENDLLMSLRAQHRREYGDLGLRAQRFTEGGYCTLFSEGMKLASRGGIDSQIAIACTTVYEDEFSHMLRGIADIALSSESLSEQEWQTMSELVVAQLKQRVLMRNAQFSHPVSAERLEAICSGACEPIAFDYQRAFGADAAHA